MTSKREAEIRAEERERCAKLAENWPLTFKGRVSTQGQYAAENIAAAIRSFNVAVERKEDNGK